MNIRDENVLRELNLYPLWVRRDVPAVNEVPASVGRDLSRHDTAEPVEAVGLHPQGVGRGCEGLKPQQHTHKPDLQTPSIPRPISPSPSSFGGDVDWPSLKEQVRNCTACVLRAGCTQTVFGVGDESAEWLFVGEGPGADEDERGEPFVGQAGKLLDNMLAAIKLQRGSKVYIANIVKCRPPNNRAPHEDEIAQCLPYLQRQIALIKPRLIVALGKTAATALSGKEATLGSLRGRAHDYRGVPLIITYHPAYLLRMPAEKARAWEDMCLAADTMQKLSG